MTKLQDILTEIASAFESSSNDGVQDPIFRLKDDAPAWLKDIDKEYSSFMLRIHMAIDERAPDDWVYEHTYRMASDLAENAKYTERHGAEWDADWAVHMASDSLVDVYTMHRVQWLAMHLLNVSLVDEACEELQVNAKIGISDRIAIGQCEALNRIGNALLQEAQTEFERRQGLNQPLERLEKT